MQKEMHDSESQSLRAQFHLLGASFVFGGRIGASSWRLWAFRRGPPNPSRTTREIGNSLASWVGRQRHCRRRIAEKHLHQSMSCYQTPLGGIANGSFFSTAASVGADRGFFLYGVSRTDDPFAFAGRDPDIRRHRCTWIPAQTSTRVIRT